MRILQNNSIRQGAHHSLQVLIPPPVRCVDPPWFSRFRIASSCASPGSPAAEPLRGTPGLRRRGRRPRRPDPSFLDPFRHGACVRRAATPPPEGEARAAAQSPPRLEGGGRAKRGRGDSGWEEDNISPSHPHSARATAPFRQGGHRRAADSRPYGDGGEGLPHRTPPSPALAATPPLSGEARADTRPAPITKKEKTDCHTSDVGHWFSMTSAGGHRPPAAFFICRYFRAAESRP